MGIEHAEFHRRLQRKMHSKDARLAELYKRTCTTCGVQADTSTGRCRVCRRPVIEIASDPVPAGVQIPVDPEQAQRQREFYAMLGRQQRAREQAATRPTAPSAGTTDVRRLPGESLPGEESEKGTGPPPSRPSASDACTASNAQRKREKEKTQPMPKKSDATGLPREMPKAPGHAKARHPPSRRELGGEKPAWLDGSQAKWTKARVEATFPRSHRPSKLGAPDHVDSIIPPVPAHRVPTSAKEPEREF